MGGETGGQGLHTSTCRRACNANTAVTLVKLESLNSRTSRLPTGNLSTTTSLTLSQLCAILVSLCTAETQCVKKCLLSSRFSFSATSCSTSNWRTTSSKGREGISTYALKLTCCCTTAMCYNTAFIFFRGHRHQSTVWRSDEQAPRRIRSITIAIINKSACLRESNVVNTFNLK